MNRILVVGGTGTVGRQAVSTLVATGAQVRAMTRNPGAARLPQQVEVVRGDLKTAHPLFQQPNPLRALGEQIERLIETSGLQWTFLRPGMFAANALSWWAPQIRAGDLVRWPHLAAPTAPIDER